MEATDDGAIAVTDIYDRKPRRSWSRGRVTLLGDAAHAMTPNLGQGAAQALEDAVVLAAELASGADVAASLRRYEAARKPRANRIVRLSRRAGMLAQAHSRIGRTLGSAAVRSMPKRLQIRQRDRIVAFDPPLVSTKIGAATGVPEG